MTVKHAPEHPVAVRSVVLRRCDALWYLDDLLRVVVLYRVVAGYLHHIVSHNAIASAH